MFVWFFFVRSLSYLLSLIVQSFVVQMALSGDWIISNLFNQRIRRNILFKCVRVCLCVWVVFIPWVARLSVFPFVFRSRLLFVMAGVQGAFACCPASCLSALLFACVCVHARPGVKSIVYNLWVWSAVDTNSHFSVYCWLSALRRACDVGRLCSIDNVINPFS